jgi:hypothetical protein
VRALRKLVLLAALAAGCTDWAALSDCAVAQSEGRRCGADAAVELRDAGAPDAAVARDAGPLAADAGPPLALTVALTLPGRIPKFFLETDQGLRLVTLSKGGAGGFAEVLSLQSLDAGVALESFATFASGAPAPQLLDAAGGSGAFVVTEPWSGGLRLHFDPPNGGVVENSALLGAPRVGIFNTPRGPAACVLSFAVANVIGRGVYPDGGSGPMVLSPCFGDPVTAVLSDDLRCVTLGVTPPNCISTPQLQVQFGFAGSMASGSQIAPVLLFKGTTGSAALARSPSGPIIAFAAEDRVVVEPRGSSFEARPESKQVLRALGSVEPLTQTVRSLSVDALTDAELIVTGIRFSTGLQAEDGGVVLAPREAAGAGEGFVLRRSAGGWRSVALSGAFPLAALGIGDRFLVALDCAGAAEAPCLGVTGTVIVEAR